MELTTDQKGVLAEAKIAAAVLECGVGVARPLGDEAYDLIIDLRPQILRLQCKWAVQRADVIIVTCLRNRRGPNGFIRRVYEASEIDAIAAYCSGNDRCYFLPLDMSVRRTAVQLRLSPTRNNQARLINWAQDYDLIATLSRLRGPIAQLGERVAGSDEAAGSSPAGSTLFEA